MTTVIDAFTHWMGKATYATIEEEVGFRGMSSTPSFLWDIDQRLSDMAQYGIDKQVVTLAYPTVFRETDRETALSITQMANDDLHRLADEHPEDFIPVATIPDTSPAFVDEMRRCIDDLEMAGVQIFTHVDGRPLDDSSFAPIFDLAASRNVPVWLHPQDWNWHDWTSDYLEHRLFGWPFETTLALSRLVYNGVMEEYPDLSIVAHHGGGMIPFYAGRIEAMSDLRMSYPENYPEYTSRVAKLSRHPVEYFKQFYVDTVVSGSVDALETIISFFGPGKVVFATDYPFSVGRGRTAIDHTMDAIDRLQHGSGNHEDLYGRNLHELID